MSGPKGEPGPEGPSGPQGVQGERGNRGKRGPRVGIIFVLKGLCRWRLKNGFRFFFAGLTSVIFNH